MTTTVPRLRRASSWRAIQIFLYLLAVAFSIGTLIGYKKLNTLLKLDMSLCLLYAQPVVTDPNKSQDCTIKVDNSGGHRCNVVFFTVISSMVYAIIGGWFFIACTSETKTRPDETVIQSFKLVVPSILFTFILAMLSIISSSFVSGGIAEFLHEFRSQSDISHCRTFKTFRPDNATTFLWQTNTFSAVSQTFTWLCTTVWVAALAVLICRCCVAADFAPQPEKKPESMSTDSSRTASLARGSQRHWKKTMRRLMPPGSTTLGRSIKESLKRWKSDSSLNQNLIQRSLSRLNSSSPEMRKSTTPPVIPLVHYNPFTTTVNVNEDGEFESARADSLGENVHESSFSTEQTRKA